VNSKCTGALPDNQFTRHALQTLIQVHGLAGVTNARTKLPYNCLHAMNTVVYGAPASSVATVVPVPFLSAALLSLALSVPMRYIASLFAHVRSIRNADNLVLHGVGWAFSSQIKMFALSPFTFSSDTQHGTNINKMQAVNTIGKNNENKNIVIAQGFLSNLKTRAFVFWFCVVLPHLLGKDVYLKVNAVCMDGSREQWAGFRAAVGRGLLHPHVAWFLCYFHRIVQDLRKPENLGVVHVHPATYTLILRCLDTISRVYTQEAHARTAMLAVRVFAQNALKSVSKVANFLEWLDIIEVELPRWALYGRHGRLTFDSRTSNATESENAVQKGSKKRQGHVHTLSNLFDLVQTSSVYIHNRCKERDRRYEQSQGILTHLPWDDVIVEMDGQETTPRVLRRFVTILTCVHTFIVRRVTMVITTVLTFIHTFIVTTVLTWILTFMVTIVITTVHTWIHTSILTYSLAEVAAVSRDSLRILWRLMTPHARRQHAAGWTPLVDLCEAEYAQDGTWRVTHSAEYIRRETVLAATRVGPTPIPEHRVFVAVNTAGDAFLRCTCRLYDQNLTMCAHVLRVKNLVVSPYGDVHPYHFQSYGRLDVVVPQFDEGERDGPCLQGVRPVEALHAAGYVQHHAVLNPTHAWTVVLKGCALLSELDLEKLGEDFTKPYQEACVYSRFKDRWDEAGRSYHLQTYTSLQHH
jgi:hypothetical protein